MSASRVANVILVFKDIVLFLYSYVVSPSGNEVSKPHALFKLNPKMKSDETKVTAAD